MSLSPHSYGEVNETPQPFGPTDWGYRDVLTIAGFAILSLLLLSLFTGLLLGAFSEDPTESTAQLPEGPAALGALLAMQAVWWAMIFWGLHVVVVRKHGWPFLQGLGWRAFRPPWTLFVAAGIGLAFSVGILSNALTMPEEPLPFEALLSTRSAILAMGVFGVLVAPPLEELAFRGFLFPVLQRKHGGAIAVFGTAALFSAMHGQQYGNHWQILLILFWVGSALGWMRLTTGSTIPSTIAHATYNFTLFLGLWFVDEEMIEQLEQMEAVLLWIQ